MGWHLVDKNSHRCEQIEAFMYEIFDLCTRRNLDMGDMVSGILSSLFFCVRVGSEPKDFEENIKSCAEALWGMYFNARDEDGQGQQAKAGR